jgi:hypothetical protein
MEEDTKVHTTRITSLVTLALIAAGLACALPTETDDVVATNVAATSSVSTDEATHTPSATATPPPAEPTATPTPPTPTQPADTPTNSVTPTDAPPPGGVSLNCDGTYQRLRISDAGASGKTVSVDNWDGSSWINVWNYPGGDAMIKQIEAEAGYYTFLGCQKLVIVPERYTGSGALLGLKIYVWNGAGMSTVYTHEGVHGTWSKLGDMILFEESLYLYGEPNCCPCNRQGLEHTWDGAAFTQTGSEISPTYSGTPPAYCTP